MDRLVFITGGARSGKSTFAEEWAKRTGKPVTYIATSVACDEEMVTRIERHRGQRPAEWHTVEAYCHFEKVFQDIMPGTVLLDCVTIMVTNLMLDVPFKDIDDPTMVEMDDAEAYVQIHVEGLLRAIAAYQGTVILVSNEVGMGVVPMVPLGRSFRDIAGRVNQRLAKTATDAVFMVSGLPLWLKGSGQS